MSSRLSWNAKQITCCTCDRMSMLHSLRTAITRPRAQTTHHRMGPPVWTGGPGQKPVGPPGEGLYQPLIYDDQLGGTQFPKSTQLTRAPSSLGNPAHTGTQLSRIGLTAALDKWLALGREVHLLASMRGRWSLWGISTRFWTWHAHHTRDNGDNAEHKDCTQGREGHTRRGDTASGCIGEP